MSTSDAADGTIAWYQVRFDESGITRDVRPPQKAAWQDEIAWQEIIRVCFKTQEFYESDEIYIFTRARPESYLIPTEAQGGQALLQELIRRGLFDAELAIQAMSTTNELFCWPESESDGKPETS
jgi:hypothetical protein